LLARISKMLLARSVVAWFQDDGFGPRSVGTRSILCDPSNRWARENNQPLSAAGVHRRPAPVSMTASAIRGSLISPGCSPFITMDALVNRSGAIGCARRSTVARRFPCRWLAPGSPGARGSS